jgi:hypothetical protein
LEVSTEIEAVEIDLTPGSKDAGFSIRIDKDWNIVIRNKANKKIRKMHIGSVMQMMVESRESEVIE